MKKVILSIAAIMVIGASSSCQKEIEQVYTGGTVFSAIIDNVGDTKSTIDGLQIQWENTDKININGINYSANPDAVDAKKASFTKDAGDDPSPVYKAIFPSTIYVSSPSAHYVLPANLTYAAEKFNIPMYAESSTTSLTFKNIFAVLEINVSSSVNVESIAVSSDLYLNGTFTIASDIASITAGSDATKTTTLSCSPAVPGTDFYIPIPAGTYTGKNLKVVITKAGGVTETMTTNQTAAISIAAGSIYRFNFKKDGLFVLGHSDKKITEKLLVL